MDDNLRPQIECDTSYCEPETVQPIWHQSVSGLTGYRLDDNGAHCDDSVQNMANIHTNTESGSKWITDVIPGTAESILASNAGNETKNFQTKTGNVVYKEKRDASSSRDTEPETNPYSVSRSLELHSLIKSKPVDYVFECVQRNQQTPDFDIDQKVKELIRRNPDAVSKLQTKSVTASGDASSQVSTKERRDSKTDNRRDSLDEWTFLSTPSTSHTHRRCKVKTGDSDVDHDGFQIERSSLLMKFMTAVTEHNLQMQWSLEKQANQIVELKIENEARRASENDNRIEIESLKLSNIQLKSQVNSLNEKVKQLSGDVKTLEKEMACDACRLNRMGYRLLCGHKFCDSCYESKGLCLRCK